MFDAFRVIVVIDYAVYGLNAAATIRRNLCRIVSHKSKSTLATYVKDLVATPANSPDFETKARRCNLCLMITYRFLRDQLGCRGINLPVWLLESGLGNKRRLWPLH